MNNILDFFLVISILSCIILSLSLWMRFLRWKQDFQESQKKWLESANSLNTMLEKQRDDIESRLIKIKRLIQGNDVLDNQKSDVFLADRVRKDNESTWNMHGGSLICNIYKKNNKCYDSKNVEKYKKNQGIGSLSLRFARLLGEGKSLEEIEKQLGINSEELRLLKTVLKNRLKKKNSNYSLQ